MQKSTIVTIISAVVAFVTSLTGAQLNVLWPGHGVQLATFVPILVLALGQVNNAISKQTKGAPQTGTQVGPLAKDLNIVNSVGDVVAKNVTTTSTDTIEAPTTGGIASSKGPL
jgi:hypothetical protein